MEDEFLLTLQRPTEEPFLLYLSPAKLGRGLGAQLIEKMLVVTAPRGLHKIDTSNSVHSSNILAAFGPPGSSLSDLVDPEQLALLSRGARSGVFAIRCRGGHCALELLGAYARKFKAFGWAVHRVNGHDIPAILESFKKVRLSGGPAVVLAKTIKGKGVSFVEDKNGWHGKPLKDVRVAPGGTG